MVFVCGTCSGTGSNGGVLCSVCGGVGEINLTDSTFRQISHGDQIALTGVIWDSMLTTLGDIGAKLDALDENLTNIFHSYEIAEAVDDTEYGNLSDAAQAGIDLYLSMGLIDFNDGKKGKTVFWTVFDSESTTRANITALLS